MLAFTTAFTLVLSAPAPRASASAKAPVDLEALARHFIEQLSKGQFATAGAAFSDQMRSSMPPDKLALLWNGLEGQKGAFQKIERASSEPVGDGTAEMLTCLFAKAPVTFQVYFDAQKHIGGLLLSPASLIARRFVNLLDKSDFAAAEAMLAPAMRKELPAPKLAGLWKDMTAEGGKFDGLDRTKVEPTAGDWTAIASARFEKKNIVLRMLVDGEARIASFERQ